MATATEDTSLLDFEPRFMGDIKGHKGVGRYTVPLDSLQGENTQEAAAMVYTFL